MLKGLRIIILSVPVLWTNLLSQEISQQVLVPMGGLVTTSANVTVSQTIGESMIATTGDAYYLITQGFQQNTVRVYKENIPDLKVAVYPNPASDYLTIEIIGLKANTFRIEIMDLTGRTHISAIKTFGNDYWYNEPWNIRELVSGFYIIRVMSTNGLINRAFRIQKI
jgi:hypothetical protein